VPAADFCVHFGSITRDFTGLGGFKKNGQNSHNRSVQWLVARSLVAGNAFLGVSMTTCT